MTTFKHSYIVCKCNNVTLGEIIYAIEEKNARSIKDIGIVTDAGITCGCCKSDKDDFRNPKMKLYLEYILERYKTM